MSADKLSEAYFTADGRLVPEKPAPRVAPVPRQTPTQRDLILAAYDSRAADAAPGQPEVERLVDLLATGAYVSPLDPPPGDRRAAHTPFCGKDGRGCICPPRSR